MKLTLKELRALVKEETIKHISKEKDKRDKESQRLSNQRKKNWLGGLSSLAKGIAESEIQDIILQETEDYLKQEGKVIPPDKLKKLCYKIGMKTYKDWLKITNDIERASDGRLFDKPKVKENDLLQDKNCGNPYRSSKTGQLSNKKDKGIKSTYFCDGTPRTKIDGSSIPTQDCGRSSRKKGKDVKCFPDS